MCYKQLGSCVGTVLQMTLSETQIHVQTIESHFKLSHSTVVAPTKGVETGNCPSPTVVYNPEYMQSLCASCTLSHISKSVWRAARVNMLSAMRHHRSMQRAPTCAMTTASINKFPTLSSLACRLKLARRSCCHMSTTLPRMLTCSTLKQRSSCRKPRARLLWSCENIWPGHAKQTELAEHSTFDFSDGPV